MKKMTFLGFELDDLSKNLFLLSVGILLNSIVLVIAGRQSLRSAESLIHSKNQKYETTGHNIKAKTNQVRDAESDKCPLPGFPSHPC